MARAPVRTQQRRAGPRYTHVRAQLADAIGDRALGAALVETTYKYVRILLRSERIKTQSGERSLLKNLGSWLGKLTIARNRPVRHRDLDLKGILYEAYAQGKMIAVLPFVNKVRPGGHGMRARLSRRRSCIEV